MWNNTDIPLAYLITFRTYGTWLHGGNRGSTSRHVNQYRTPHIRPNHDWLSTNAARMLREPVTLDAARRGYVEEAIRDTRERRRWRLDGLNVRTNHAHAVFGAGQTDSSIVLNALKANATRVMRQSGVWTSDKTPWADKGSQRYLWNEQSLIQALDYVLNYQGDHLPTFY